MLKKYHSVSKTLLFFTLFICFHSASVSAVTTGGTVSYENKKDESSPSGVSHHRSLARGLLYRLKNRRLNTCLNLDTFRLKLQLVNTKTNAVLMDLKSDVVIDLKSTGPNLTIIAIVTTTSKIGQVKFRFDSNPVVTESAAPYSIGRDVGTTYNPYKPLAIVGSHTLTGEVISTTKKDITCHTITFTVVNGINSVPTPLQVPTPIISTPVDNPTAPLAAPVPSPVLPVTDPVAEPIDVPVEAPVAVPIEVPVEAPIEAPVEAPVDAPVEIPIDAPIDAPIEAPVEAPVPSSPTRLGEYKASPTGALTGELKKWHKITIGFNGPSTNENDTLNPFLFYRLDVSFRHVSTNRVYLVPGYYGADGKAAHTQASSGNVWLVHFAPDQVGVWDWEASFKKGNEVAVTGAGVTASFFDGESGSFTVQNTDKTGSFRDLRGQGRLKYVGEHYLRFAESGNYFVKAGADSPENLLNYEDFDNTPVHTRRKSWSPHVGDFKMGDPTWTSNGKGKGLIGAINYLSGKGMNVFSFLTMNLEGDDKNVFPYTTTSNFQRFDVSKLSQWEIVLEHADKMGMYLHFKTQETENDQLLDRGELGVNRKLYYRELIARFSHHLALNWNLGEENTNTDAQRKAFAHYFNSLDPYKHHVVVHTYPGDKAKVYGPMLGFKSLTGTSSQQSPENVVAETREWVRRSSATGHKWVVSCDEQNPADTGVVPDDNDLDHDIIRKNVLWGNLMNNGGGVEYYFGYKYPHSDLSLQDYRSRDRMWTISRYALDFFTLFDIPFWNMQESSSLLSSSNINSCMATSGKTEIIIYLRDGGTETVNLSDVPSTTSYDVHWYDTLKGGQLQRGSLNTISGGGLKSIGNPPSGNGTKKDWAIRLRKN